MWSVELPRIARGGQGSAKREIQRQCGKCSPVGLANDSGWSPRFRKETEQAWKEVGAANRAAANWTQGANRGFPGPAVAPGPAWGAKSSWSLGPCCHGNPRPGPLSAARELRQECCSPLSGSSLGSFWAGWVFGGFGQWWNNKLKEPSSAEVK